MNVKYVKESESEQSVKARADAGTHPCGHTSVVQRPRRHNSPHACSGTVCPHGLSCLRRLAASGDCRLLLSRLSPPLRPRLLSLLVPESDPLPDPDPLLVPESDPEPELLEPDVSDPLVPEELDVPELLLGEGDRRPLDRRCSGLSFSAARAPRDDGPGSSPRPPRCCRVSSSSRPRPRSSRSPRASLLSPSRPGSRRSRASTREGLGASNLQARTHTHAHTYISIASVFVSKQG